MRKNLLKAFFALGGIVVSLSASAADYVSTTVNADDASLQDVTYNFADNADAPGLAVDMSEVVATVYNTDGSAAIDLYSLTTDSLSRLALDANVNSSSSSAENGLWWWRKDRANGDSYDFQDGLQLRGGSSYTGGLAVLNLAAGDKVVIYGPAIASSGSNYMLINFPGADRIDDEAQDPMYKADGEAEYTVSYTNATSNTSYGTITIDVISDGFVAAYVTGNNNGYIRTLTITEAASGATVEYTVKYVDENGNTLKASETRTGVEGSDFSITDDDKASLTVDGTKYVYDSYTASSVSVTDGAILTVVYREAQVCVYTVYQTIGDIEQVYVMDEAYEGETVVVAYPVNINFNGTLYSTSQTNGKWAVSIAMDPEGSNEASIAYNETSTTDVLLLIEGEDIEGFEAISDISSQSMLGAGYAESATVGVLGAGEYTIGARFYLASGASNTVTFKVGEETIWTYAYSGTSKSDTFTVEEASDLTIEMTSTDGTAGIDFLYVFGTGTISTGVSTGIETVAQKAAREDGIFYNLQGVKVLNPTKGLYIQNGKKVIVR